LDSGKEKPEPWFASTRQAQNELVSNFTETQLEVLTDFFERSAKMWEDKRGKLQKKAVG